MLKVERKLKWLKRRKGLKRQKGSKVEEAEGAEDAREAEDAFAETGYGIRGRRKGRKGELDSNYGP